MYKISITLVFKFSRGLKNIYIYNRRTIDITFLKAFSSTAPAFHNAEDTAGKRWTPSYKRAVEHVHTHSELLPVK